MTVFETFMITIAFASLVVAILSLEDFQQNYRMGAIQVAPGFVDDNLKEKILDCLESLSALQK